jgi:chemotaxis protein MotB
VSKKKYNTQLELYNKLNDTFNTVVHRLDQCLDEKGRQKARISNLEDELARLKKEGSALLGQLSDLSIINKTQAESIRQSLENINSKEIYIRGLQSALSRKDSLNMALVLNLKGALADIDDKDVQINVEGSAVFISISDKLLFKTGSYEVNKDAKNVLKKVAQVLQAKPEFQFMVEGHTDSVRINNTQIADNWELSVLRATAITRSLQKDFGISPQRMVAAGRGEYSPVAENNSAEGRAKNRRTRIVILPQLDQFFKLLETKP